MDPEQNLSSRLATTPPGVPRFEPRLDDVFSRARTRRRRRVLGGIVASAVALLGLGLPLWWLAGLHGSPRQPLSTPVNGKIAYTLWPDSGEDIYTINPDGTGDTLLSDHEGLDQAPVWSPDGTQIAFTSFRPPTEGHPAGIYLMNGDGTGLHLLVENGFGGIAWSPDGSQIAFSRGEGGNTEIYIVDADGSGLTRLTDDPSRDVSPTWSPDGRQIAFVEGSERGATGTDGLYVMNADGSDVHPVLTDRIVGEPQWSPTADRIVFESPRGANPDGPTDIYTVNADGTDLRALTDDLARDLSPTWSPDGTKIAFSSDREGVRQIFVMDADGSNVRQVTSGPDAATFPSWGTATISPMPTASPTLSPGSCATRNEYRRLHEGMWRHRVTLIFGFVGDPGTHHNGVTTRRYVGCVSGTAAYVDFRYRRIVDKTWVRDE